MPKLALAAVALVVALGLALYARGPAQREFAPVPTRGGLMTDARGAPFGLITELWPAPGLFCRCMITDENVREPECRCGGVDRR